MRMDLCEFQDCRDYTEKTMLQNQTHPKKALPNDIFPVLKACQLLLGLFQFCCCCPRIIRLPKPLSFPYGSRTTLPGPLLPV